MDIMKAFPTTYLSAKDLDDQDMTVTIKKIVMEEIGRGQQKETKPVLYFSETDKGLTLNKTNAKIVSKLYGTDTDNWIGKKITLWPNHDVQFGDEVVSAIRVRSKAPNNGTREPGEEG